MKKIIVLLGVLGVSLSAIFVKITDAPSMVLVFYRTLAAALMLLPAVCLRFRGEITRLTKKEVILCVISGIFLGLHFTAYFESLRYTSIAASVVLVDTEVFFVAFAMLFIFREKISVHGWIGIIAAFVGSVIVAMADAGAGSDVVKGDLIALSGAAFMAVYTLIGKVVRKRISTTVYTFLVYVSSACTVLIFLAAGRTPIIGYGKEAWISGIGMAVFCTLLGHSVFSWALKYEKASFISTAKLMEPIFASIMGMLLFKEIPGIYTVLGGAVIIFGIFYYSRHSE
ncbi:MAG TPA: EamA/RhaT family transporter [Lachnospiraceae bacterium]|nr:EamA/RhaT family transporter [Lachnospiraceae bacterium]